jgi:hypothetical protein
MRPSPHAPMGAASAKSNNVARNPSDHSSTEDRPALSRNGNAVRSDRNSEDRNASRRSIATLGGNHRPPLDSRNNHNKAVATGIARRDAADLCRRRRSAFEVPSCKPRQLLPKIKVIWTLPLPPHFDQRRPARQRPQDWVCWKFHGKPESVELVRPGLNRACRQVP